ncbi:hypothetical protein HHI36_010045 [Cryptolaemus montrouzieri]|uniref:Venom protein n=1 Tax=Cryptolaemus montrouzieri TaxID=559131 RepID=A0ABD2MHM0_9CUCU
MLRLSFLIVYFVFNVTNAQLIHPGKITGIPSLPQEALLLEYKPKVEVLKLILIKEIEDLDKFVILAQNLVRANIASSKEIATQKIKDLKQAISAAKDEAKYASSAVKMCINKQDYEVPRLYVAPPITCYINYTDMVGVKNKLLKLQFLTGQLLTNCQQLYMDDCDKDITMFKRCLTERIDDIYRHIERIKDEFGTAFTNVINNSLQCLIRGNFETFKSIGEVMSSLKHCKNVPSSSFIKI